MNAFEERVEGNILNASAFSKGKRERTYLIVKVMVVGALGFAAPKLDVA